MPELGEDEIGEINAKIEMIWSEWWKVWERYNEELNNRELMPIEPPHITTVEDITYFLFQWAIISSLVYLLILLVYYIFCRFKKKENPLKYAFKKSRLWWITILLIPVVIFVVCIIVNGF